VAQRIFKEKIDRRSFKDLKKAFPEIPSDTYYMNNKGMFYKRWRENLYLELVVGNTQDGYRKVGLRKEDGTPIIRLKTRCLAGMFRKMNANWEENKEVTHHKEKDLSKNQLEDIEIKSLAKHTSDHLSEDYVIYTPNMERIIAMLKGQQAVADYLGRSKHTVARHLKLRKKGKNSKINGLIVVKAEEHLAV
jgi:hypothetical protein